MINLLVETSGAFVCVDWKCLISELSLPKTFEKMILGIGVKFITLT